MGTGSGPTLEFYAQVAENLRTAGFVGAKRAWGGLRLLGALVVASLGLHLLWVWQRFGWLAHVVSLRAWIAREETEGLNPFDPFPACHTDKNARTLQPQLFRTSTPGGMLRGSMVNCR